MYNFKFKILVFVCVFYTFSAQANYLDDGPVGFKDDTVIQTSDRHIIFDNCDVSLVFFGNSGGGVCKYDSCKNYGNKCEGFSPNAFKNCYTEGNKCLNRGNYNGNFSTVKNKNYKDLTYDNWKVVFNLFYEINPPDRDWTKFINVIVKQYDNKKEMNWTDFLADFIKRFQDQNKFEDMGDYLLDLIQRNSNK